MNKAKLTALSTVGVALIAGCPQPSIAPITLGTNTVPTVDAGGDLERMVGDAVALRATGVDQDGDALSYRWTLLSGPGTDLANQNSQTLRFTPERPGEYTFSVQVSDDRTTDEDTVSVFVSPQPNPDTPEVVEEEETPVDEPESVDLDPNDTPTTLVESTFDRDHEDWTLNAAGSVEGGWRDAGGRPGGHVIGRIRFTGGHWQAPGKFNGDWSAAVGGTLRFDFSHQAYEAARPGVRIQGVDGSAVVRASTVQDGWASYAVRLDASGGWLDLDSGRALETEDLALILRDVVSVQILVGVDSTTGLDNVQVVLP